MTPGPAPIAAIAAGDRLVLDTSAVIAYLKGDEPASPAATTIIDTLVATERNPAIVSAITVAELLVRPIALGRTEAATMTAFLLGFPSLSIRSADFLVAAEAARIRARTRASSPDSLIAATATVTSSQWLVTNDQTLVDRLSGLDWSTRILVLSGE